jgi:methionine synthase I (cobalamin-dependent)
MEPMIRMAQRMHQFGPPVPLLAKPSASLAGVHPVSPESFAQAVPMLVACGVRLLGGCCGSTQAHVAALRAALDAGLKLTG